MRYEVASNLVIDAGATEVSHSVELGEASAAVAFDVSTVEGGGTSAELTVNVEGSNDLTRKRGQVIAIIISCGGLGKHRRSVQE